MVTALLAAGSCMGFLRGYLAFTGVTAVPFAYISFVISLTARRFSNRGGDFQNKIHQLLVDSLRGSSSILDIGCGSGNLLIKAAKQEKSSLQRCVGVDSWGKNWQYSLQQCEENAVAEGISTIEFVRGGAASLPFENLTFEAVTSCLTFHEVQGIAERHELLYEALRVLQSGGRFAFLDLFGDGGKFESIEKIKNTIRDSGCEITTCARLSELMKLPYPLNTKKVLKNAYVITGTKSR